MDNAIVLLIVFQCFLTALGLYKLLFGTSRFDLFAGAFCTTLNPIMICYNICTLLK